MTPSLDRELPLSILHLDKTFIGRMEKGFHFLGYHFGPVGLTVARATIERFDARATRLYEQERQRPHGPLPLGELTPTPKDDTNYF